MIPEFIGRLPMIGVVRSLDRDALIAILTEPKNALVKQYAKVFEFEDVELEFTDDGLEAVADQALLRGTGARGLRAILEEVLLNTMYDVPGRTDVGKVVIDGTVVRERVNPTLVPRNRPLQSRPQVGVTESTCLASQFTVTYDEALAYLDEHASYDTTGRIESPSLGQHPNAVLGDGRSATDRTVDPRHRHQRQGLDGADDRRAC